MGVSEPMRTNIPKTNSATYGLKFLADLLRINVAIIFIREEELVF